MELIDASGGLIDYVEERDSKIILWFFTRETERSCSHHNMSFYVTAYVRVWS